MERAADILGRLRIVIAGDPDPLAAALKRAKTLAVAIEQPRRAAAVMKTVAQRGDEARRILRDQARQPRQSRRSRRLSIITNVNRRRTTKSGH